MAETRTFYCLRCQARFPLPYDPKAVVERTCPRCASNGVRLETEAAAAAAAAKAPRDAAGAAKP